MFQDLKIKLCKKSNCMKVIWSDNDYVKAHGFECRVCNYSCCNDCEESEIVNVCVDCVGDKLITEKGCVKCNNAVDYEYDDKLYCYSCMISILQD